MNLIRDLPLWKESFLQSPDNTQSTNEAVALPQPLGSKSSLRDVAAERLQDVRLHLRDPLYLNAYALMLNTIASAFFGMVFWMLATRNYSVEAVGQGAALVSTMMLISTLTSVSFNQGLFRFLPRAGTKSKHFIIAAYGIVWALAVVATTITLLMFKWFGDEDGPLSMSLAMGSLFVLSTATWSVFNLQDAVLTAMRRAIWIPIENAFLYGVAKIVLLFLFVPVFHDDGIFASWIIPMFVLVVPVNLVIFFVFLKAHVATSSQDQQPIYRNKVARYLAGDYLATLSGQLSSTLMPLLVISTLSATANGYFYVAQIMAFALEMVANNFVASLIVEASTTEHRTKDLARIVLKKSMMIMVPAALVLIVFAPWILQIFGPAYSENSTTLLRLLALTCLPRIVNSVYNAVCRIQHRTHIVGIMSFSYMVMFVGGSLILMPHLGIEGIGVAALASQLILASYQVPRLLAALRSDSEILPKPVEVEVANVGK